MTLKSYKSKKKKEKKKGKSEFMKKPLRTGIKLGLGFAAMGLGLSAMNRT